jgi:parallel beta-helix repeat protein
VVIAVDRIFVPVLVAAAATLAVGLGPAAPAAATGRILYVDRHDHACSDSGPGTLRQPFCTISQAAAKVRSGQTVRVSAGTYSEQVRVSRSGTSRAPIVFAAAPRAKVIVRGGANGFTIKGRWIKITGFTVTRTRSYGIDVSQSSHITLADNHVSYAGKPVSGLASYGIRLNHVADSLVTNNITDHNTNSGIALVDGSAGNTVRTNHAFANAQGYQRAASGIRLFDAPGNTIAGNFAYQNEDSGIECDAGSDSGLVYNNVAYLNGDHGIDNYRAPGTRIIANTVYGNATAGINVEGNSPGARIVNNITVDNGINSPRTRGNIRVDRVSIAAGTRSDFNVVYLTAPGKLVEWDSVGYSSLSAFRSATGQEVHGIQADPRWIDPVHGDFHLRAGSPAIDAADSAASGQPKLDAKRKRRVDDPATPNTGIGPRTYDDRGPFEFRPNH